MNSKISDIFVGLIVIVFNVFVGVSSLLFQPTDVQTPKCFYKAAVYEHPVVIPKLKARSYDEAVEQMMVNLKEYKRQADIAGSQGVDIIVFPEDGIYGNRFDKPSDIENYLEYIPDPTDTQWTPCLDPHKFHSTKVQSFLSCLAMNNSLYLVANYGDMQPCLAIDPNCPHSGHYQYNTNIVFNRQGQLIAKYHKQNLFFEEQFQEPVHPEMVFFDTDFGRFGIFTCFDILFHDPAIPLVEKFNVTDIVFPTAWMDTLPFFSAIGYHSSFAAAYKVNFLASNIHHPLFRFQGSGIYTPDGALTYFYNKSSSLGRLLVHDVPIISRNKPASQLVQFKFNATDQQAIRHHDFQSDIFHDLYNFVNLSSKKDKVAVCQDGLCCFLSYERDQIIGNYVLGVFNGIHKAEGHYYLQVCILLECDFHDNRTCDRATIKADGYFNYFNIKGNFSTSYVTPQVITSDNESLMLPQLYSMKYNEEGLTSNATYSPLLEASLIGRVYESD